MKPKQLFLNFAVLCTALLFSGIVEAKTWRVNNLSNYNGTTLFGDNYGGTPSCPVCSEINEAVAYSNVVDGERVHIEGSTKVSAGATITKQLTIIGPGYFLTENPKVSNNTYDANIYFISFNLTRKILYSDFINKKSLLLLICSGLEFCKLNQDFALFEDFKNAA